tara:strand:+ start:18987 stop:20177 length:1191 start_codon:yes stop_codon:yes gene_type:complete
MAGDLSTSVRALRLDDYQKFAVSADRSGFTGDRRLRFLLLGLFGEVGSLLSELKKKQRDRNSYLAYERSSLEETGDVLWYLANVADALGLKLSALAARAYGSSADAESAAAATEFQGLQGQQPLLFATPASGEYVERTLLVIAARVGRLVRRASDSSEPSTEDMRNDTTKLFAALVDAASDAHINLEAAALANIEKVEGRWPTTRHYTPLFDESFDDDERLPRRLVVNFREKEVQGTKFVFQSVKGINLGDRLTDNSADEDDYRFHDVFHLAFAAVLGWSPVVRALLKLKRKSDRSVDENEDGARAIITEEGISNWVFSHGLRHEAFADVSSLDFDLLRTIRHMVKGYEVQVCPMWMWEEAILQGFKAFRHLQQNRSGTVVADLTARTLKVEGDSA